MLRKKICCIASVDEAFAAIDVGATAIGLVGPMPSGPGVIDETLIREIVGAVGDRISTFLLTSYTSADAIIDQHRRCGTSTIQIVDEPAAGSYAALRDALDGVEIVQVIHVESEASVAQALEAAKHVDALLLDSGTPSAPTKVLGGTGKTHDWELSAQIVRTSGVPVYLAGGLNPENVAQAVRTVVPYGVDVCSGLRSDGALDVEKARQFIVNASASSES